MPRPKGLRHKWQPGSRASCLRPGCRWSRDRSYIPARYFHPDRYGGGETEAPVCDGTPPGIKPADIPPPAQPANCGLCGKPWEDGHPCRATPQQWKAFWAPAHKPDDCPAFPAGCLACNSKEVPDAR